MLSLGYLWFHVIHGRLELKPDDKVALPLQGSSQNNYIILIIYYVLGLRVSWSQLNSQVAQNSETTEQCRFVSLYIHHEG